MKKIYLILILCISLLVLCACGGNVSNVYVEPYQSNIYSNQEIDDAINEIKQYFQVEFSGCTLTTITYAGDAEAQEWVDWARQNNADEVIVLTSSFDVDASGGDGSLNPNSTYNNWLWILVRDNGGKWRHADHGY